MTDLPTTRKILISAFRSITWHPQKKKDITQGVGLTFETQPRAYSFEKSLWIDAFVQCASSGLQREHFLSCGLVIHLAHLALADLLWLQLLGKCARHAVFGLMQSAICNSFNTIQRSAEQAVFKKRKQRTHCSCKL